MFDQAKQSKLRSASAFRTFGSLIPLSRSLRLRLTAPLPLLSPFALPLLAMLPLLLRPLLLAGVLLLMT